MIAPDACCSLSVVDFHEATDRPEQATGWKQKLAELEKAQTEQKSATPAPRE